MTLYLFLQVDALLFFLVVMVYWSPRCFVREIKYITLDFLDLFLQHF